MKKALIILFMCLFMISCNTSQNKPINGQKEDILEENIPNLGGWQESLNKEITSELNDMFYKALNIDKYKPIELMATQVVAGLKYKFKAIDNDNNEYIIVIFKDIKDNLSVTSIDQLDK